VRTLILILICSAFVVGGVLDARTERRGRRHMVTSGLVALLIGVFVCWLLVYVVGIFDDWQFSFRHYVK
jgi:hypothetical protein